MTRRTHLLGTPLLALAVTLSGCNQDEVETPVPVPTTDIGAQTYRATGVVREIIPAHNQIALAVEPVPSLQWSSMVKSFLVADKALLEGIAPNQTVQFEFAQDAENQFVIIAIKPE